MFGVGKNENSLTDPSVNNDLNSDFAVGSLWFNRVTNKTYICLRNDTNNALWKLLTLTDDNGNLVIPAGLQFSGGYSSSELTGNTDNLIITNLGGSSLVRMSSTINVNLTGIQVPDQTKSYFFSIFNVGSSNIIFKNNNSGSLNENRFLIGSDINVQGGEGLTFIYDPVDLKWRSPGKNI